MAQVLNKVFFHFTGYDDAPEFALLGDGTVQIDGEEVSEPAVIVKALADNAKAWSKCVDRAHAVEIPAPVESAVIKETEATLVQTYHGFVIRGPWPAACTKCGQIRDAQGGEYPCEMCGRLTVHDPEGSDDVVG